MTNWRKTDQIVSDLAHPHFFSLFQNLKYGELHLKQDIPSGLLAIIAIHSTQLGPALGGCRFLPYPSLDAAIIDALRLAQGMSYKAAICNIPFGGGKSVIIRPPNHFDRTALFRAFGQFVHTLGGRYITAEDSGTGVEDMDIIHLVTPHVTGHTQQAFACKDPSPLTALGVRRGIEAAIWHKFHRTLENIHVAIQGLGHVGYHLAKELHQKGASLTVCDIDLHAQERCVDEFGAKTASLNHIHQTACDVFSPCALGNAINKQNIHDIQAPIIAGSANNQLENPDIAEMLQQQNRLYAPDFVINAGGLIHVAAQYQFNSENLAKENILKIYDILIEIFERSQKENVSTLKIANALAERRLFT
jgi:leucine dehydrogenase